MEPKKQTYPMNGKWLPDASPVNAGVQNYTELKNVRPKDGGYETCEGYGNITTVPIETPLNAIHFKKEGESHVLVKQENSGTYEIIENDTVIPSQGNFGANSLVEVSSGQGSFSNWPQGLASYVDEQNALAYGGDELRVAACFLSGSYTCATYKDVTEQVNNGDTSEIAEIGTGGVDSYVVLMLHGNGTDGSTTITDSSPTTPHTVTANGNAQIDTADKKFGTGAILFDGTGDYLSIPDNADFALSATAFTIDFWSKASHAAYSTPYGFFQQRVDANNLVQFYTEKISSGRIFNRVTFEIKSGGSTVIQLQAIVLYDLSGWHHYEIACLSGRWVLFTDGILGAEATNANSYPDLSSQFELGRAGTGSYLTGSIDEFRISKGICRHSASFTPSSEEYSATGYEYLFIGTPYKPDGYKFYVQNPNTIAVTADSAYWSGSTYSTETITDGTSSGGKTLAQTGSITFDYTESPAIQYLGGVALYWRRLTFSGASAGIYKVTYSAPFQKVRDVWNGVGRNCILFQLRRTTGGFEDYTYHVNEFSTEDAPFAAKLGSMSSAGAGRIMFEERMMSVEFTMLSDLVNAVDAQINAWKYWNGSAFVSVDYFVDKTLDAALDSSFSQTGVVSWTPPSASLEQKTTEGGKTGYIYEFTVDGTLTAGTANNGTSVDFIKGITAPLEMNGYDLCSNYANRAILIKGNRIDYSQTATPWCFNGVDSSSETRQSLYFGSEDDIVATKSVFNRYGASLIESLVVCKKAETYLLIGVHPSQEFDDVFRVKRVSERIGCVSQKTMHQISLQMGAEEGSARNGVMWLDSTGPIFFDGTVPISVTGVDNYFDRTKTECINYSYMHLSNGYFDDTNKEYNVIFPSGSSTVNNKWLAFSFPSKKWYEKVPSSYPVICFPVVDVNGGRYNYGLLSDGTMLRLDYSQAWNGTAISQTVTTGEFSAPFDDEIGFWTVSEVQAVKLLSEKILEDTDVTINIYSDGTLSSKSLTVPLDASVTVSRNTAGDRSLGTQAYMHKVKFSTSTSTDKWKPLIWGYKAIKIRED